MALSWWQRWAKQLMKPSMVAPVRRKRPGYRPRLEALEGRLVPTQRVWDGSAATNNWLNAANWSGSVAPVNGDDLVFPDTVAAADRITTNDIAGLSPNSIRFDGDGYTLNGNSITLGTNGITSVASGAENTINLGISLSGINRTINVALGSRVTINAAISGPANLIKTGDGVLELSGSTANTYSGTTTVNAGTLALAKSAGVNAIPGNLTIGDGVQGLGLGSPRDQVQLLSNNQIANAATVTINDFGRFNMNSFDEGFDSLNMSAGEVTGPSSSRLGLRESFTRLFPPMNQNIAPIISIGDLVLQSGNVTFDIPAFGGNRRLEVRARLSGGGFIKTGGGELFLSGTQANTFTGSAQVRQGTLILAKTSTVTNQVAAVSGPLVVGDNRGSIVEAVVRAEAIFQFDITQPITVNRTGLITLDDNENAIGPLTLNGGHVSSGSTSVNGGNDFSKRVVLGGDVTVNASDVSARISGILDTGSASRKFIVADGPAAVDLVIDALLRNGGSDNIRGLTKFGPGSMVLNFDSFPQPVPISGSLSVVEGLLRVNGDQPEADLRVDGGILETDASIVVDDVSAFGGVLSPGGDSTGIIRGSILKLSGGSLRMDLNGTTAGEQYDQLQITSSIQNSVLLLAGLEIRLGFTPQIGDKFTIIKNEGSETIGFFTVNGIGISEGGAITVNGQTFVISYQGDGFNDVVLTRDNPPAFQNRSVTTPTFEGQVATLTGTITEPDAGDTFFLDVTWGDGTPVQTYTFPPGSNGQTVNVTHRYLDNGNFNIFALWRDQHGGHNSATLPIEVKNVAPDLTGLRVDLDQGHRVTISGHIVDPGRDSFTLVVNWGDGESNTYHFARGTTRFEVHHRYDDPGRYKVRLKLSDDDGGQDRESLDLRLASRGHDAWWIALCQFLGHHDDDRG